MDPLNTPDEKDIEENNTNKEIVNAIESCQEKIQDFKKRLYFDLVSNDKKHDSDDLGGLMTFHALFLQTVGYWIGCLDGRPVPMPSFSNKRHTAMFLEITRDVQQLSTMNVDSRILLYSMLFNTSIQHPYDLGSSRKKNESK